MSDAGIFPTLDDLTAALGYTEPAVASDLQPDTSPPEITFATSGLQPPTPLYVTKSDQLQVQVWNSLAAIEVDVTGRLLRADGSIIRLFQQLFPTSNSLANTFTVALTDGFLLDLSVNSPTASVLRGQCFIRGTLVRGPVAALSAVQLLVQDYIGTGQGVQWPGGLIRGSTESSGFVTSQLVSVGAGLDWSVTVPTGQRWRITHFFAQFTASATVATRIPFIFVKDGSGNIIFENSGTASVTASQFVTISGGPGVGNGGSLTAGFVVSLPMPAWLTKGMSFGSNTSSKQVGDQWSAIAVGFEQYAEPV